MERGIRGKVVLPKTELKLGQMFDIIIMMDGWMDKTHLL